MPNPHFGIKTVTPTPTECVTLDQMKAHLRVTESNDDELIGDLISAARELVESWTRRTLLATQYLLTFDRFPLLPNNQYAPGNPNVLTPVLQNTWPLDPNIWALMIPRSPLVTVDSIQYVDLTGTLQTMDPTSYTVDAVSEPGRLTTSTGSYWPNVKFQPNAVQITFTAGYSSADLVPATLKLAIKLLVGFFYDNPNWHSVQHLEDAPPAVQALVAMNTVQGFW